MFARITKSITNYSKIVIDLDRDKLVVSGSKKQLEKALEILNAGNKHYKPFQYNATKTAITGSIWHMKDVENFELYLAYIKPEKNTVGEITVIGDWPLRVISKGMTALEAAVPMLREKTKVWIALDVIKHWSPEFAANLLNFLATGKGLGQVTIDDIKQRKIDKQLLVIAYDSAQEKFAQSNKPAAENETTAAANPVDAKAYRLSQSAMGVASSLREIYLGSQKMLKV